MILALRVLSGCWSDWYSFVRHRSDARTTSNNFRTMQTDIAAVANFSLLSECVNTIPVLNSRLMILIVRLMGKRTCLRLTYIRRIGHIWSEIASADLEREVTRITVRLYRGEELSRQTQTNLFQLNFNFVSMGRRRYSFKLIRSISMYRGSIFA